MAVAVVDRLEQIEVEHRERQRARITRRASELLPGHLDEAPTTQRVGQRVPRRQATEPLLDALLLGQVREGEHPGALVVEHERAGVEQRPGRLSVARPEPDGQRVDGAVVGEPLEEDVPLLFIGEELRDARADDLLPIDLQQRGRLLVAVANGPFVVDEHHGHGRRVEELAEVLLAADEPPLLLARQRQDAVDLLGDGVEEERGRVVLVALEIPGKPMREVALAELEESLDEDRRD